ncbi:MAG: hypothetical protein ACYCQJ_12150 [Nitrososphaerales archaeon]
MFLKIIQDDQETGQIEVSRDFVNQCRFLKEMLEPSYGEDEEVPADFVLYVMEKGGSLEKIKKFLEFYETINKWIAYYKDKTGPEPTGPFIFLPHPHSDDFNELCNYANYLNYDHMASVLISSLKAKALEGLSEEEIKASFGMGTMSWEEILSMLGIEQKNDYVKTDLNIKEESKPDWGLPKDFKYENLFRFTHDAKAVNENGKVTWKFFETSK